jgi:UDP-N-acetylmuramoylalanine--D-glutamate ligase
VAFVINDAPIVADDLRGKRVTIVGLGKGRTSRGLAEFLARAGAVITITDKRTAEELGEGIERLGDLPVALRLGVADDDALVDADYVFLIPGVPPTISTIVRAESLGIPVLTEIGLFFQLCPAPIVAVTGTKGKTTTTTLIGRVLERGDRPVIVAGNIGEAVIHRVPEITARHWVVLELSSFQLETLRQSPHIAVVTNVTSDHIDWHGSTEAYVRSKRSIVAWQRHDDWAVINLDDPTVVAMQTGADGQVFPFSLTQRLRRGAFLDGDALVVARGAEHLRILDRGELRIPGRHNVANALAAAAVGVLAGIPTEAIADALRTFEGVAHRQEPAGTSGGVLYVNNSQGTTPESTITALESYDRPAVLILGGVSKGANFRRLAEIVQQRARGVVLIGQAADEIASALSAAARLREGALRAQGPLPLSLPIERAGTMREAVAIARALAREGDVVLLSPACASFDMFRDMADRGDQFRALVREFAE